MKKVQLEIWVIVITLVFSAFVLGYFVGRNRVVESQVVLSQNQTVVDVAAMLETEESEEKPKETVTPPPVVEPEAPLLVNINTASAEALDDLPGIGPALAKRIVEYRQTAGPFASPQELEEVSGIGEQNLATMLPYITIE